MRIVALGGLDIVGASDEVAGLRGPERRICTGVFGISTISMV